MTLQWLFHTYQRRLLQAMFEHPLDSVYISELARRAGVDPGNTKRYLEKFGEFGIVKLSRQGRTTIVTANLASPEMKKIFELYEIDRTKEYLADHWKQLAGITDAIAALTHEIPDIRLVVLFGQNALELDQTQRVNLGFVIGAERSVPEIKGQIAERLERSRFPLHANLVFRSVGEADCAWKNGGVPGAELWQTRIVLFGEDYFWRMVARHGAPVNAGAPERG